MTAVTYEQIAADWGVSLSTVRHWMTADNTPRRRAGKNTVVSRTDYEAFCLRRFGRLPPAPEARADFAKARQEIHQLIGLAANLTARANALLEALPGPET